MCKKTNLIYENRSLGNLNFEIKNNLLILCALSSYVCRETSRLAFINKGISLTAPDVIAEISNTLSVVNPFK